jgi:hypothetical protein
VSDPCAILSPENVLGFRRHAAHHALAFVPLHRDRDARVTTLAVPGYRQARNYTCGYAAALMILRYFHPDAPAQALYTRLGTCRDGTRQNAIVRELRRSGVSANVRYDCHFGRIVRSIDQGKPIIGYLHDIDHWMVVYGYGRDPDRVFVADPEPQEPCEHRWSSYGERLGHFGIICSSRSPARAEPPAPARRAPILLPASPLAAERERRREPTQLGFGFRDPHDPRDPIDRS